MLLLASQMVGPPVYAFKRLPLTFPKKSYAFNFTNCTVPPSVIVEIPTVDHLVMQCTKEKHLIYFYKQFSEILIEHEQHQA